MWKVPVKPTVRHTAVLQIVSHSTLLKETNAMCRIWSRSDTLRPLEDASCVGKCVGFDLRSDTLRPLEDVRCVGFDLRSDTLRPLEDVWCVGCDLRSDTLRPLNNLEDASCVGCDLRSDTLRPLNNLEDTWCVGCDLRSDTLSRQALGLNFDWRKLGQTKHHQTKINRKNKSWTSDNRRSSAPYPDQVSKVRRLRTSGHSKQLVQHNL